MFELQTLELQTGVMKKLMSNLSIYHKLFLESLGIKFHKSYIFC